MAMWASLVGLVALVAKVRVARLASGSLVPSMGIALRAPRRVAQRWQLGRRDLATSPDSLCDSTPFTQALGLFQSAAVEADMATGTSANPDHEQPPWAQGWTDSKAWL